MENVCREPLANVSHDSRTSLTMIKGYAEIVREIFWNDEVRREQDLSVLIWEADRLTKIISAAKTGKRWLNSDKELITYQLLADGFRGAYGQIPSDF